MSHGHWHGQVRCLRGKFLVDIDLVRANILWNFQRSESPNALHFAFKQRLLHETQLPSVSSCIYELRLVGEQA